MAQKYSKRQPMSRDSLINTEIIVEESIERFPKCTQKWDKYVYTLCILFCNFYCGLGGSIFAPSMVDMKFLFRTTMANINYSNSFESAGYLTGSLFGFLYKYVNRQLSFIFNTILMGVFTALFPICTSLWQLYLACFLVSLGTGAFDSGNSVWIVEMWKQRSSPVFHLSQMMYGLGTIIGPLMVNPFVYGDLSNKTEDKTTGTNTTTELTTLQLILSTPSVLNSTSDYDINYSFDRRPKLMVPYLISGGLTLTVPIVLLIMFFIKRYKIPENQTLDENTITNPTIGDDSNDKAVEVSPNTKRLLILLVALSLSSYSGFESTFFDYMSTYYQYLPIHLSASSAATVMAVMTTTYTVGRLVSAYVSSKLSGEVMIAYHLVIILLSLTVLYLGKNSLTFIYVGNAMIGFGFSTMWSSYYAIGEKYIGLTDKICSIFSFTSTLINLGTPFLLGPKIEKNPQIFLNVLIGLFCSVVTLFILIMIVVKRSQRYPIAYTVNYSR